KAILLIIKITGGPGRGFEHGRTAESPVGDEHRTAMLKVGVFNRNRRFSDRNACQVLKDFIPEVEGEERRKGFNNCVTKITQPVVGAASVGAAGGNDHGIGGQWFLPANV